jgi:hypothetical protein
VELVFEDNLKTFFLKKLLKSFGEKKKLLTFATALRKKGNRKRKIDNFWG